MRASGVSARRHRSAHEAAVPSFQRAVPRHLVADVDVVVVVGHREGRAAEGQQGDDLPRLQLGREQQDVAHGALGDPAGR